MYWTTLLLLFASGMAIGAQRWLDEYQQRPDARVAVVRRRKIAVYAATGAIVVFALVQIVFLGSPFF